MQRTKVVFQISVLALAATASNQNETSCDELKKYIEYQTAEGNKADIYEETKVRKCLHCMKCLTDYMKEIIHPCVEKIKRGGKFKNPLKNPVWILGDIFWDILLKWDTKITAGEGKTKPQIEDPDTVVKMLGPILRFADKHPVCKVAKKQLGFEEMLLVNFKFPEDDDGWTPGTPFEYILEKGGRLKTENDLKTLMDILKLMFECGLEIPVKPNGKVYVRRPVLDVDEPNERGLAGYNGFRAAIEYYQLLFKRVLEKIANGVRPQGENAMDVNEFEQQMNLRLTFFDEAEKAIDAKLSQSDPSGRSQMVSRR